jgi:endonuclease YncB( thermonuclease family)
VTGKKSLVERFKSIGLPGGVVSGFLIGMVLGGAGVKKIDENIYKNKAVFLELVRNYEVIDGDTFIMDNGLSVRLLGVDAPNRGQKGYEEAGATLERLLKNKEIWLEYDRYQIDQFGRALAWVWVDCNGMVAMVPKPTFLPANYMEKSKNESNPGLTENPDGCKDGKLINEEMVKAGMAKTVKYGDRGELKYEKRLMGI